jgi:octaprenyl-diphosphate synthase
MCRFKTGALARFAAYSGSLIGGGAKALCEGAAESWEKAGVGFQILDDVKNLTTGNPGKDRGDDIVEGKKSLPVILYYQSHQEKIGHFSSLIEAAAGKGIKEGSREVEEAIGILEDSGSIARAEEMALSMLGESASELRDLFPESASRELQCRIIESFR